MSKKSQFKINQRVREGIEGQRGVQLHVMRTMTEKIADIVAVKLKNLVIQEVHDELERRGYSQEAQESNGGSVTDSEHSASLLEARREDTDSSITETTGREECPSEKVGKDK